MESPERQPGSLEAWILQGSSGKHQGEQARSGRAQGRTPRKPLLVWQRCRYWTARSTEKHTRRDVGYPEVVLLEVTQMGHLLKPSLIFGSRVLTQ